MKQKYTKTELREVIEFYFWGIVDFISEHFWWLSGLLTLVVFYMGLFLLLSYAENVDYENYIQLCVDNGYTNKQCEMRYTELKLTTHYEPDIIVGTGIVR